MTEQYYQHTGAPARGKGRGENTSEGYFLSRHLKRTPVRQNNVNFWGGGGGGFAEAHGPRGNI